MFATISPASSPALRMQPSAHPDAAAGDDPSELQHGSGWHLSSWDLQSGLTVVELEGWDDVLRAWSR